MARSIYQEGDVKKKYNIGIVMLAVFATIIASVLLVYIWQLFNASTKLKFVTGQANALRDQLIQFEKENINLRKQLNELKKPFHIGEKLIYKSPIYHFTIELPDYFAISQQSDNELKAESESSDRLLVEIAEQPLDEMQYINQSSSYSWQYNAIKQAWQPVYDEELPDDLAPKKYINDNGYLIYYVASADGGGQGNLVYIEDPNKQFVITIDLSWDKTTEHESNADTIFNILDSLTFE